ncbi:MaoC/PaaZ C-terminal domain-containing protein [Niveispirillum sp. KHB5.9]|uniref:MaoC/PaaZ C-terminal domain-containing protein n=1 Tax=Niveispirillum sp. KHB5.9 TaxID=3400269 RepID=UPI003A87E5DD
MPDSISIDRTLTQAEFDLFARLSGDDNPIHVDPAFSARTRFGRTVAHGLYLCSILRGLAGQVRPGVPQLAQDVRFPAPTYTNEPMHFFVEATGNHVVVKAVRIADGTITCEGTFEMGGAA